LLDHKASPYTAESYRIILKSFAINLDAIERLSDALKKSGLEDGDVLMIDDVAEATVDNANQLTGLVEFAILRVGQLVNPMELDKLPSGTPGTPEFEAPYGLRVEVYKLVDLVISTLQKTYECLMSPLHKFGLSENDRGTSFRAAKKAFLTQEIDRVRTDVTDAKKFIDDCETVLARLVSELQSIDQTTIFSLPDVDPESN
jgi:hypothetical protein